MATPTWKSPAIDAFLQETFGRRSAILGDRCVLAPVGCGNPATEFRNEISRREYRISGLCQECQDSIFGVD